MAIPRKLNAVGAAINTLENNNFDDLSSGVLAGSKDAIDKYNTSIETLGKSFSLMTPSKIADIAASNGLGEAHFEAALLVSTLTEEQKNEARAAYNAATAKTTDKAATDALTLSVGNLTTALKGLIAKAVGFVTANPFLSIAVAVAAVVGAVAAITTALRKHEEAIQETIDRAQELQEAYREVSDEITADIETVSALEDEFERLSRGVSEHGKNISLSADEYSRYLEIVETLISINPTL